MQIVQIALRALQFLWTLLVLAITGNMIAIQSHGDAIVNYVMFCAVFAMLALFYLLPAAFIDSLTFHPIIPVALDGLISLFWFCAAVALAAYIPPHSCSDEDWRRDHPVVQSEKHCREGQAVDAFLWFGWAAFVASAIMSGLASRGSVSTRPGGIRKGGPSMSKV